MSENMAVTSGIDGLAELAGGVVQGILHLCDLVDDLRDAPREAAGLKKELRTLQAVLKSICPLARAAGYDAEAYSVDEKSSLLNTPQKELTALERAIQLCDSEVKTIQALVLAIYHTNRKGRSIAKWLKRLLNRLRMVLQKLKLQRRIQALQRREKAVCAAAAARQVPFRAPAVLGQGPALPSLSAARPGLATSPGMTLRPAPVSASRLSAVPVPGRAQTQAHTSTQIPASSPVRPTIPCTTSSRPYIYTHYHVEAVLVEPQDAAGRGTHSGRGQCMVFSNPFCIRPRSRVSVREIVEISDEDEEPPRPVCPTPSTGSSGSRQHTPSRPLTPSSILSLTRSATHASDRGVTTVDRQHDESDSCDTFETAWSADQDEHDSEPSRLSQSSSMSELLSLSEPVTPRFPPHWPNWPNKSKGGSLNNHHRDSVAKHLRSFSEIKLLPNPEPYQGRDSDDDDLDPGPSSRLFGRGDKNRHTLFNSW
ncbi:hypothetical protein F503_00634 [Ophiostoma piceae UAMH 11346]|uniref:Uncharacterized protein n=1 Tax=Ophiostoma piceae (strain UAMH 11346) TaxID=1262450 RepID=S3C542_OPHP1|nr:hypothetical protein F503_00634 [Ophiostoma piceae UAMH 11346]